MDVILSLLTTGLNVPNVSPANATLPSGSTPVSVLAGLQQGSLIRGYVINRDPAGNPILRTESGTDFLVQSKFFLKIGSDVVVKVDSTGATLRTSILSVDGVSPKEAEAIPAHNRNADFITRSDQPVTSSSARGSAVENAPRTREGITLSGTLVQAAPANAQPPSNLTPLASGARLLFRLLGLTLPDTLPDDAPAETSAPRQQPAAESARQHATPPTANPPRTPPSPIAPQLSAYTKFAALPMAQELAEPVHSLFAPPFSGQAPTVEAPDTTQQAAIPLQATVTGSADSAEPLLQTLFGMVRLAQSPPLPLGSKLALELLGTATGQPIPADEAAAARPAEIVALAKGWQTLAEIITTLTETDADSATQFLRLNMPASAYGAAPNSTNLYPTSQNLTSGLFFFLNAMGGAGLRHWLGARVTQQIEDAGHGALVKRAEGEFNLMRQLYTETPPGQWQALFLPVMVEGELKPLRFFSKRERGKRDSRQTTDTDTRFVVEMELSQTGPLQLDGLVRKHDAATQFDLVIRSSTDFSDQEKRDIQQIFASIGEATGYAGSLQFQQTTDFPVKPLEEILASDHRNVVV